MKRLPFLLFVSGLTAILSLGVFWTEAAQAKSTKTFTLDVACDFSTAGFNHSTDPSTDVGPLGPRARGIIVNGNIYPEGVLPSGESPWVPHPTDPDTIGTWRCLFAALGAIDLPLALVGAVTYYFQLEPTGHDSDESMIMVQGLNSHTHMDFGLPDSVPRVLAVVGGTGRYAGATGEVREEVLGTNTLGCFNLRFHFRIHVAHGFKKHKQR
jgi:hypothetical protein